MARRIEQITAFAAHRLDFTTAVNRHQWRNGHKILRSKVRQRKKAAHAAAREARLYAFAPCISTPRFWRLALSLRGRHIGNRYDFKGSSAKVELQEKEKLIILHGDSDFQLSQIKDILFPEMEKKERESTKRLDAGDVQVVSGNKAKQELKIKVGIESELAKKLVKLIKDSKLKVQASIQGDVVRVTGAKRDLLQETIALVKKSITDFPLKYGNFRD